MEQYQQEISEYNPEQAKRYELISRLQQGNIELSYSWLKEMLKSPSHFLSYKLKDYTPPNEGMIFGSMVDCLITEPKNFSNHFTVIDKVPTTDQQSIFCNAIIDGALIDEAFNLAYKRGNAEELYTTFKDYINAVKEGKTTTTSQLKNEAQDIADRLQENKSISLLLDSANVFQQKTVIEYEGWKIKRFTDVKGDGMTADLKLMSKLNPNYVDREVITMDYDLQGAVYTLDNLDRYFNICYDRKGNSIITEYDESILAYGKDKLDYCLRSLYKCCENPSLFSESYNFHDLIDDKLGIKIKRIYKPGYVKSYRN